jgi:hypothetical protein
MPLEDDDLPDPGVSPPTRDGELRRMRVFWGFCCASPLVYLLVAMWINGSYFSEPGGRGGLINPDPDARLRLWAAFVVCASTIAVALPLIRRRGTPETADRAAILRVFRRRVLAQMALCDLAAFLGFVLFVLTADMRAVLVGGLVALLCYGQSYPTEGALDRIAKQ